MNVLIIELGGSHMENVYTLVHLLHLKQHKVFFICNENLNDLIKEREKFEQIYFVPNVLTGFKVQNAVLKLVKRTINAGKIDTVIFGTTEIKPVRNMLPFLRCSNIIGIIHNALKLENSATFKYIYPLRIKKYLVFGDFIKGNLKKYPAQNLYSFYPCYFPEPSSPSSITKAEGEKWIIVPGGVIADRKDFIPLLESLSKISIPDNLRIILLGKLYSDEKAIIDLIKKIIYKVEFIKTFDDFLSYDLFHSYLKKSDYILPLLKLNQDSFYGDTRISGAFNLAYSYHLPLILPYSYKKNTDLLDFSIYYKDMGELMKIFLSVSTDEFYASEIKLSYKKSKKFDFNSMADSLISFIEKPVK